MRDIYVAERSQRIVLPISRRGQARGGDKRQPKPSSLGLVCIQRPEYGVVAKNRFDDQTDSEDGTLFGRIESR